MKSKKKYSLASRARWAKRSIDERSAWGKANADKRWAKVDAAGRLAHAMKMVNARKAKYNAEKEKRGDKITTS